MAIVTDWSEHLSDRERAEWEAFVEHERRSVVKQIAGAAFVMSLVPAGEVDIKFAVELGLSIMLDKPIVALVQPGTLIPDKLRRVADRIVVADVDTEEGRGAVETALEEFKP
jgi:hypothetical protein